MMTDLQHLSFCQLTPTTTLSDFTCGDEDLDNFLRDDAKRYLDDLMAVTYLFVDTTNGKVAAFFSLLNDKVAYNPEDKTIWNRINRRIHNSKRRHSYPSVKIGRLAVSTEYANTGLGSDILNLIKRTFVAGNRTGCRFITVDAYAKATSFYLKNGFDYFTSTDVLDATRLMYFDLKPYKDSLTK